MKKMKKVEVETDERNIFRKNKTETVEKWTGKVVLAEDDYLILIENVKKGIKAESKLNQILETDTYRENRDLKLEIDKLKEEVYFER